MLVAAAALYAQQHGWQGRELGWIALLALVPASELTIQLLQRVISHLVPPRRLPRLDLDRVPASARTIVIVPTILDSVERVAELTAHLEVQALGNLDPNLHFAILSDFPDATVETLPGDAEILAAASAAIDALNTKHAPDRPNRFFLFHRLRQWNEKEGLWMGWERKRGKIEEFNRLLRGATDTSFTVQVGDLSMLAAGALLHHARQRHAPAARRRPPADWHHHAPAEPCHRSIRLLGRVTEGYGILQPRVSVTFASAAGSLFARLYSGHTGVDPYTTAVSDTYQDLFGEGIFTGKGLYDVDAFTSALGDSVPENALLSHDLFEGLHARVALVSDVELVDEYPSSVLTHARRQHRWIRGDWQILFWLFPFVPSRSGLRAQHAADHRPMEDPRQPASQPGDADAPRAAHRRMDGAPRVALVLDDDGRRHPGVTAAAPLRQAARRAAQGAVAAGLLRQPPPGCGDSAGANRSERDVSCVPRVRDDARDRAHAGPPGGDETPIARMGNGRLRRRARDRAGRPQGRAAVPGRHGVKPRDRRRRWRS